MASLNQYFTSIYLANQVAEIVAERVNSSNSEKTWRILEPCAGTGSLVSALTGKLGNTAWTLTAYEIDDALCKEFGWINEDFLLSSPNEHDVVVCNPPFHSNRDEGTNGSRGADLPFLFLQHAAKSSSFLVFIMHQNKGCNTFQEKVRKAMPDLALTNRICVDKPMSMFKHNGTNLFIPVSVYVYQRGCTTNFPIAVFTEDSCSQFTMLNLNDKTANVIVKRWGSPKRVGRLVSMAAALIQKEVNKTRTKYGPCDGVNFHIHTNDVPSLTEQLGRMESFLNSHFSYARDCPNVSITKSQFVTIFLRSQLTV